MLHNLGLQPIQPIAAGPPSTSIPQAVGPKFGPTGTLPAPASVMRDPGFLQRLLGLGGDESSIDQILKILASVSPGSASSGGGGIGGLVGSILGLGKDK